MRISTLKLITRPSSRMDERPTPLEPSSSATAKELLAVTGTERTCHDSAVIPDGRESLAELLRELTAVKQELGLILEEWNRLCAARDAMDGENERLYALRLRAVRWELATAQRQLREARDHAARLDGAKLRQRQQLEGTARELEEQMTRIEVLEAELARVQRRLSIRAGQLQAIYNSRSFRLATRASGIKYAVLQSLRGPGRRVKPPRESNSAPHGS